MIGKLKKLKGKGLAELKDRGRQKANVLAERFGVSTETRVPTEKEIFEILGRNAENASAVSILADFRSRTTPLFFASFDDPLATTAMLRRRFSDEASSIIERADRICEGKFDLLGYKGLSFGPGIIPNWHFDPVSQKSSPLVHWSRIDEIGTDKTGDKKVVWELNRHQYFSILGRSYWLTGDEKYAGTFAAHAADWMDKNPQKLGLNWLSSLEIAFRSISWLWALYFFRDSPNLDADLFLRLVKHLYLNGRHLERHLSTYSSPNTHLTGEALALYFIGTVFPEFASAAHWKETGYRVLLDALAFQVRADGTYCEQSTQYHRYTADFYATLMILRGIEGLPVDATHREKFAKLLEFLIYVSQPNGETPLIGDDDGGRLHFLDERPFEDFRSTVAVGAVLLSDPYLRYAAGPASAEILWLLGLEGVEKYEALDARSPAEKVKAFADGGSYSIRDSWEKDANFLFIDCGEHGFMNGGHAHADALSFVLSARGEPVFVDAGTYNYTSDPDARARFRSTAAHNCLTVNGGSSSVPNGPFSWRSTASGRVREWKREGDVCVLRGTHLGYEEFGVRYEREFTFVDNDSLTVVDDIKSSTTNVYEVNFILSPKIVAHIIDNRVLIRANDDKRLIAEMTVELSGTDKTVTGRWDIESFSVSPRYGCLIDSAKLSFQVESGGDLSISSKIRLC